MQSPVIDHIPSTVTKKYRARKSLKNSINVTLNTNYCTKKVSKKINSTIPKNINKKNGKGETVLHQACRSVSK